MEGETRKCRSVRRKPLANFTNLNPIPKRTDIKEKTAGVVFSTISPDKTKNGGDVVYVDVGSSPAQKAKDKGKAIARSNACPPVEGSRNKLNDGIIASSFRSANFGKNRGKEIVVPANCPVKKAKDKAGNSHVPFSGPFSANKSIKRKSDPKKNNEIGVVSSDSSCPPLPRNQKHWNAYEDSGDILPSKAYTAPHPNKKKRCPRLESALPGDYIEQQRAYFKEIDEFELPVEEVTNAWIE